MLNFKSVIKIFSLCLLFLKLNAQSKTEDQSNWNVKIGILNFIDSGNPAIQLGIERFINNKNSLQFEAAYILPYNFDQSEEGIDPNYKGYIFRIAYKYWLIKRKLYVGPEVFTLENDYVANEKFVNNLNDENAIPYFDRIGIERKVSGIDLKGGYIINYNRFFIDFTLGAGLSKKIVQHSDRININDFYVIDSNFTVSNILNKDVNEIGFHLSTNIKLGFSF